jgi:hypothetical protein
MANSGDSGGQRPVADLRPAQLEGPRDGALAARTFGGRDRSRASVDDERRSGQGFSSGRRKGPAVHDAAFYFAPVRDEVDAPAGIGAIDRSPFAEPPVRVHTPDVRTSFDASYHLGFAQFHATLLSLD